MQKAKALRLKIEGMIFKHPMEEKEKLGRVDFGIVDLCMHGRMNFRAICANAFWPNFGRLSTGKKKIRFCWNSKMGLVPFNLKK